MYEFWITFLSITAGAIGYLMATFWVRPILRYRDIKYQVASDLIFFADAISSQTDRASERMDANRRRASDLAAINGELPSWYRWWLTKRHEDLKQASKELIGLSNAPNIEEAKDRIENVRQRLRIRAQGS